MSSVDWPGRGGKRGSDFNRSAKLEARKLTPSKSVTAAQTLPAKIFYPCHEVEEVYDPVRDKIVEVPVCDKSTTARQYLRILPQRVTEVVDLKGKQVDKRTNKLIHVTDQHIVSKTPRSLLNEFKPFTPSIIKRETSKSKRIKMDEDQPLPSYAKPDRAIPLDFDTPEPRKSGRKSGKIL